MRYDGGNTYFEIGEAKRRRGALEKGRQGGIIGHWDSIPSLLLFRSKRSRYITLFKFITIFCGIDHSLYNIFHIHMECEEYFTK